MRGTSAYSGANRIIKMLPENIPKEQKSLAEIVEECLKNSPFKDSLKETEPNKEGSISLYRQRFSRLPLPHFLKNFKLMRAEVIYIYDSIIQTNIDVKDNKYIEIANSLKEKFEGYGKKVEIEYKK